MEGKIPSTSTNRRAAHCKWKWRVFLFFSVGKNSNHSTTDHRRFWLEHQGEFTHKLEFLAAFIRLRDSYSKSLCHHFFIGWCWTQNPRCDIENIKRTEGWDVCILFPPLLFRNMRLCLLVYTLSLFVLTAELSGLLFIGDGILQVCVLSLLLQ